MKRDKFSITMDGEILAIKFAWNSAWRGIADLVRVVALAELQTYNLVAKSATKDENENHVIGYQIWKGEQTGKMLTYWVRKVGLNEKPT